MSDKEPLIKSIFLKNILSFGEEGVRLDLRNLNVLIGPNGSGKSNVLAGLGLLQSVADGPLPFPSLGEAKDWIWKGGREGGGGAQIEVEVDYPGGPFPLRYRLDFTSEDGGQVLEERVENAVAGPEQDKPSVFFGYRNGLPTVSLPASGSGEGDGSSIAREAVGRYGYGLPPLDGWLAPPGRRFETVMLDSLDRSRSILSQRRGGEAYPELTYLAKTFSDFAFYFQSDPVRYEHLVNALRRAGDQKKEVTNYLRRFNDQVCDYALKDESDVMSLQVQEKGLKSQIPLARLSDGTRHFLYLTSILLNPADRVICIEEPEVGLHPDIMQDLAELLLEASNKTQLFVTTHSDALVDALSTQPEAVVVCEKDFDNQTKFTRLSSTRLKKWLKEYRLGKLWRKGEIGGNRW